MTQILEKPGRRAGPRASITVGISDMKLSRKPDDVLVTHALGACVGLTLYDPVAGVGGLIHCMLPLSRTDPDLAGRKPCVFVDTGVAALLDELVALGAQRQNLVARIAGAGSPRGGADTLRIGPRNYTTLRRLLWKNNIAVDKEDVGGCKARTLYLHMTDGRTTVESEGQEVEL